MYTFWTLSFIFFFLRSYAYCQLGCSSCWFVIKCICCGLCVILVVNLTCCTISGQLLYQQIGTGKCYIYFESALHAWLRANKTVWARSRIWNIGVFVSRSIFSFISAFFYIYTQLCLLCTYVLLFFTFCLLSVNYCLNVFLTILLLCIMFLFFLISCESSLFSDCKC